MKLASLLLASQAFFFKTTSATALKNSSRPIEKIGVANGIEGEFVNLNDDLLLFEVQANDEHDNQPWVTDGTNTYKLGGANFTKMDFYAGFVGVLPETGQAIVFADDGVHGKELWATDGTPEGTYLLRDFSTDDDTTSAGSLVYYNGLLYFTVFRGTYVTRGNQLWVTNGTVAGTHRDNDDDGVFAVNADIDRVDALLEASNGATYFTADGKVYSTNGTGFGTRLEAEFVQPWNTLGELVELNGDIYFHDGTFLSVLRNGTAPAEAVAEIEPVRHLVATDNAVYFVKDERIWRYDGGISSEPETLLPGMAWKPDADSFRFYSLGGNRLVFEAQYDPANHTVRDEVWITDGTDEGTFPVVRADLLYGNTVVANEDLSFFVVGGKLYETDGTPEGTLGVDLPTSEIDAIQLFRGHLYVSSQWGSEQGVWRIDLGLEDEATKLLPLEWDEAMPLALGVGENVTYSITAPAGSEGILCQLEGATAGWELFVYQTPFDEKAPESFCVSGQEGSSTQSCSVVHDKDTDQPYEVYVEAFINSTDSVELLCGDLTEVV